MSCPNNRRIEWPSARQSCNTRREHRHLFRDVLGHVFPHFNFVLFSSPVRVARVVAFFGDAFALDSLLVSAALFASLLASLLVANLLRSVHVRSVSRSLHWLGDELLFAWKVSFQRALEGLSARWLVERERDAIAVYLSGETRLLNV